jgi:hypothetical protein
MKEWQRVPDYWFDSRWYYFAKNHGRAYAACATILHLIGGSLHWLRCKLTGKRYGAAPYFLRTMAAHDFAAVFKSQRGQPVPARPQIGE